MDLLALHYLWFLTESLAAILLLAGGSLSGSAQGPDSFPTPPEESPRWSVGAPILIPGPTGQFDEIAVKDPSIVFDSGRWHVFYTARGQDRYSLGYVSADRLDRLNSAPRSELKQIHSDDSTYAAAPQVFFFEPQGMWYLIFQTRDAHYQPAYSTTATIEHPNSWSAPRNLVEKTDSAKWIDFWVLCHEQSAYLYYTRDHRDVYVMTTRLQDFPNGFQEPTLALSPVHEAVHVYRVRNVVEFHMLYETRTDGGLRRYGLAKSDHPLGPWLKVTDNYISSAQFQFPDGEDYWTGLASHGEMIRSGSEQGLEYDPSDAKFLIQGLAGGEIKENYSDWPWKLGILTKIP